MNLPNKLTMLRIFMIPFFVLFMSVPLAGEYTRYIALAIFILASLTDALDGHIARSRNLITDFGKFMDPLADKMLVCAALICLTAEGRIPAWVVILIIAREFVISGFRQIAADKGVVIAASYWGKFKTVSQMALIILMILAIPQLKILELIVLILAVALTLISMADYLWKNRKVLEGEM